MYDKILVPVDGSVTSALGLDEAIRLAKNQGAKLRIVHVVDDLIMSDTVGLYTDELLESLRGHGKDILAKAQTRAQSQGLDPESVLLEHFGGRAAELVVDEAKKWGANLIVLGTHGRRGMTRLVMGSDAEEIVRTTPVPVLLVRSPTNNE